MSKIKRAKPLQKGLGKQVKVRVRHVKDIGSARSFLSHVIAQFQRNEVDIVYAKTIAYLLHQYANLWKIQKLDEFDERLQILENRLEENNVNQS